MSNYTGTLAIVEGDTTTTFPIEGFLTISGRRIAGILEGAAITHGIIIDYFIEDGYQADGAGQTGELSGSISDFEIAAWPSGVLDFYEMISDELATREVSISDVGPPTTISLFTINFIKDPDGEQISVVVSISLTLSPIEGPAGVENENDVVTGILVRTQESQRVNEIGSSFDNFGIFSDVERLENEHNFEFNKRIKDAIERPAGATVSALMVGLARDLGLRREHALDISLHPTLVREVSTENYRYTRIQIVSGRIKVYTFWLSGKIVNSKPNWKKATLPDGREFDFALQDLTIGRLVDLLNEIEIEAEEKTYQLYMVDLLIDRTWPAQGLLEYDSKRLIQEDVTLQERIKLLHSNIAEGSLSISENPFLTREVPAEAEVVAIGDYYIDYEVGLLVLKGVPSDFLEVTYLTYLTEIELEVTPIGVVDLQTESAQETLFAQIVQKFYKLEDEKLINGMPTNEMFGILRKLLTAGSIPQRWGE